MINFKRKIRRFLNLEQSNERYMIQQTKRVKKYTDKIINPSKDFSQFLTDYFTGHPMIRGRGEEDMSVWERLSGEELETAKQMILDNLGHDSAYIRALGIFRDARGIPLLENLVETLLDKRFNYERLYSAKVLYDWVGYAPYIKLLESILPNGGDWTKTQLDYWINGIDKSLATHYIFLMLRDESSFVRWCAYDTYKQYFNLGGIELHEALSLGVEEQRRIYKETKYYTGDDVYYNEKLFESRMKELEDKI